MRIKKKLATTGVAALIGLTGTAVGAAVLPAAPASAEVLINYPGTAVKVGHTFTVGDWFQQWSGGSRWFSTTVYGPTGARVTFVFRSKIPTYKVRLRKSYVEFFISSPDNAK